MSNVSMPSVLTVFVALTAGPALASTAGPLFAQQVLDCPDVDDITKGMDPALAHVRYLADDALEGRGAGTSGARCAAHYIADQFKAIGLEGAGPNGTYFQPFPIRAGAVLGAGSTLRTTQTTYTLAEDWIPFGYSASAAITGTLLYGGDGINRPQSQNNEYPTLDLTGRIVVVEDGDVRSPSSRALQTDAHFKASVAAGRNAGGMIILLGDGRGLPDISEETRAALRIPVAAVRGEAADQIRQAARGGDRTFLAASVQPRAVEARNVTALLPGSDPALADEVLIIGAHYDHLGFGGEGSLDPDAFGEVHNGADDNASGTSGLIEIARRLFEGDRRPARSILFLAFTAEEKGLWGSNHYVRNPLLPITQTVAMLNMDMIGRLEGRTLTVMGVGTAEEWTDVLRAANQSTARPLGIATSPDGFGPSDHSSFYGEGLPVLHFFSNTHVDYHRPSDDWDKVDIEGLEQIVDLVSEVALDVAGLSGSDERIALTPVEANAAQAHGHPSSSTTGGGYGPYLGTIPDMVPVDSGLRLTGVREGSPADEAGIMGGDIVVEFGGREVGDIYAYTYALQDHEPGDAVEIVVLRDGDRLTFTAVLGDRR
jgi:aminopeptidase YwaD